MQQYLQRELSDYLESSVDAVGRQLGFLWARLPLREELKRLRLMTRSFARFDATYLLLRLLVSPHEVVRRDTLIRDTVDWKLLFSELLQHVRV